jgi:hypothetical protein
MTSVLLLIIIVFLAGIYFCAKSPEAFTTNAPDLNRCPNMLVQKDSRFFLYNSKIAKVPGVNPIEFNNLEEYSEFLDWQRSQGIRCPVLFMQQTYDAQGHPVYKVRPSPTDLQGGLPPSVVSNLKPPNPTMLIDATQSDRPYNINSYPAFDNTSYYVGTTTPLDAMNTQQQSLPVSPDPMDPNWGGADYTQSLVDQGYYAGNEVSLRV